MYTLAQPRLADVAGMLHRSLDHFVRTEGMAARGVNVRTKRIEDETVPEVLSVRIEGVSEPARFRVRHVGGNVYDVVGGFEGASGRTFTTCLPTEEETPLAPKLGRAVGNYLLDEAERRMGEALLRRVDA
jgi:hypothetical protein